MQNFELYFLTIGFVAGAVVAAIVFFAMWCRYTARVEKLEMYIEDLDRRFAEYKHLSLMQMIDSRINVETCGGIAVSGDNNEL